MLKNVLKLSAVLTGVLGFAAVAQATPITTPPPALIGTGDIHAVYAFADAGATSNMSETLPPPPTTTIFCNHSNGTCVGGTAGQITDLGIKIGAIQFQLANINTGSTFLSNVADGAGVYHVLITPNYSDFGVGAVSPLVTAALAPYVALGQTVTYVGWEDITGAQGSDYDYNDLIFAFTNLVNVPPPPTRAPEPITLSLFGAGLIGAAAARRRNKAKKA